MCILIAIVCALGRQRRQNQTASRRSGYGSPTPAEPQIGVYLMHNDRMSDLPTHDPEAHLRQIRAVVAALRVGEVVTYGLVAARAGLPGRARLVGRALRTTPDHTPLPWHRVVGAGGRIVFPPGSPEADEQAHRLRAEGVDVIGMRVRLSEQPDLDALLWGVPTAVKMSRNPKGGKP